jgi:hypothetical protein
VLDAARRGTASRADLAARTGLPPDVVDAAVDHLIRTGALHAETLGSACPAGGCAGCGAPTGHGCGDAAARTPGPVLITLGPVGGNPRGG